MIEALSLVLRSCLHRQPPNSEWVSGEAGRYPGGAWLDSNQQLHVPLLRQHCPPGAIGNRVHTQDSYGLGASSCVSAFHAARQNHELGDGDSLPGGRLSPPASAINSREGGESAALDLNGVSGGPSNDEAKSQSAGGSAPRPNWETGVPVSPGCHVVRTHVWCLVHSTVNEVAGTSSPPIGSEKEGEAICDLASWATDTASGGMDAQGEARCGILIVLVCR